MPLDPAFPADRLSFMTSDAAIGALISETEHFAKLGVARAQALLLDEDQARLAALPATRFGRDAGAATPDTSAYIIYTSGSTGRPKGVQVTHSGIANLFASLHACAGHRGERHAGGRHHHLLRHRHLRAHAAAHRGRTRGHRDARSGPRLGRAAHACSRATNATVMQATPAGWRILLESGWEGHKGFKAISGGEPLAPDLANALLQALRQRVERLRPDRDHRVFHVLAGGQHRTRHQHRPPGGQHHRVDSR